MRSHDLDLKGTLGQSRSPWATPSDGHLTRSDDWTSHFFSFTSSLDMSQHIFLFGVGRGPKKIMHQSGWNFFHGYFILTFYFG